MSAYDPTAMNGDVSNVDGVSRHGLHESKVLGVVIGIVTDNVDPRSLGRVRLRLPRLSGDIETGWARVASFMAGQDRGAVFLPEVDDEVLVAFEHGDVNVPYVIGSLYNGKDTPPYANEDSNNNKRLIQSRSGHVVRLDDTPGQEKIEIEDKSGENKIVIDSTENKITIEAKTKLELKVGDEGSFVLKGKEIIFEASDTISMTSTGTVDLASSSKVNVLAPEINLN